MLELAFLIERWDSKFLQRNLRRLLSRCKPTLKWLRYSACVVFTHMTLFVTIRLSNAPRMSFHYAWGKDIICVCGFLPVDTKEERIMSFKTLPQGSGKFRRSSE